MKYNLHTHTRSHDTHTHLASRARFTYVLFHLNTFFSFRIFIRFCSTYQMLPPSPGHFTLVVAILRVIGTDRVFYHYRLQQLIFLFPFTVSYSLFLGSQPILVLLLASLVCYTSLASYTMGVCVCVFTSTCKTWLQCA